MTPSPANPEPDAPPSNPNESPGGGFHEPIRRMGLPWPVYVFIVLGLYVLSVGPVAGLAYKALNRGTISPAAVERLEAFYGPLLWTIETFPSLQGLYYGYVGLFLM